MTQDLPIGIALAYESLGMSRMLWAVVTLTLTIGAAPVSNLFELETFESHSRLGFSIPRETEAKLETTPTGVRIVLKGLTLHALGAPFGNEKEWLSRQKLPSDVRVERLALEEGPQGVVLTGAWVFPGGERALAKPQMEVFQFRDPDSRRFVVDFWVGDGMTRAEARSRAAIAEKNLALLKAEARARKRDADRAAKIKLLAAANDDLAYCSEPVNESNDVFLPFFPEHRELDLGAWFPGTTADSDYPYRKPEGSAEDARSMRLAIELYQQGKTALAIRAVEFLEEGTPNSSWLQEARFLRANSLLRLGHTTQALAALQQIALEAKGAPVALYARRFLAVSAFNRKEYLGALEQWNGLIRDYGDHSGAWMFHFVAAECLFRLRQPGAAEREYRQVMELAPDAHYQAMAAFRIGDVHLDRQNFAQAAAAYFQAAEFYGGRADQFPEVFLNRGEALYGLGDYALAEREFSKFLKRFPSYPAGWRATYRMAEIAGRSAGVAERKKSRDSYLETVNRFPTSPGAVLARLRLLPCGDHGGFNAHAAKRFYEDAAKPSGFEMVMMNRFVDMRVLSELRSLVAFGETAQAIERAVIAFRAEISPAAKSFAEPMLRRGFRNQVLGILARGDDYGALAFYERLSGFLPLEAGQIPADFILELAKASDRLELGSATLKHLDEFARLGGAGSDTAFASLLKARSLWRLEGRSAKDAILAALKLVPDDSGLAFDREVLLGQVTGETVHFQQAYVIRQDPKVARAIAAAHSDDARFLKGETELTRARKLETEEKWSEAVSVYEDLLKKGASNRVTYLQARARERLKDPGQLGQALQQYQSIVEKGPDDFWKKLAQEALAERQLSRKRDENQGG